MVYIGNNTNQEYLSSISNITNQNSQKTEMNLITSPKKKWKSVNLTASKTKWKWSDDSITQVSSSTERRFPSGSILITQPEKVFDTLSMSFKPGSVYHSGLIFNLIDVENFMVFVVNKLSASYRGYQIEIGEFVEGKFLSKCKEKYQNRLGDNCTITIANGIHGLSMKLNNNEIFTWHDVKIENRYKLGLYTQQNDDALFSELIPGVNTIPVGVTTPESIPTEVVESSMHKKLKLKDTPSSQGVVFQVFQALDTDLNESILQLVYPPKEISQTPIGLPEHQITIGTHGVKNAEFETVEGMATDSENNVYVVDRGNQRIQVFDTEGNFVKIIGGNDPLKLPIDVVIRDDNSIAVLDKEHKAVIIFDQEGRILNKYDLPATSNVIKMAKNPDGTLLVADTNSQIFQMGIDGKLIATWGSLGSGKNQFNRIKGISVDHGNDIIAVAEDLNKRVQLLNSDGTHLKTIGGNTINIEYPNQLEVDKDGNIYLGTGFNRNEIIVLNDEGVGQSKWSEPSMTPGMGTITTDDEGHLYVAAYKQNKIIRYTKNNALDADWQINNLPAGFMPTAICMDKGSKMLWGIHNYSKLFSINLASDSRDYFEKNPRMSLTGNSSISVNTDGEVLIVNPDSRFSQIQRYDGSGKYLGNIGMEFPFGNGYFRLATAYLTYKNWILVHDRDDFYCFDQDLTYKGRLGEHIPILGAVTSPDAFSATPDGGYLVNKDYKLFKYDNNGQIVEKFGNWSTPSDNIRGYYKYPSYDKDGNLYALVDTHIIKLDKNGFEDKVWREAVNKIQVGSTLQYRFTELSLLCSDNKDFIYAVAKNGSHQWEILKISSDGSAIVPIDLNITIPIASLIMMRIDTGGNVYLCTQSGSTFQFYKFDSSLKQDTIWNNKISALIANYLAKSISVRDVKLESNNHLSLFVYDAKSQNHLLTRISPEGTEVSKIGGRQTFFSNGKMRTRADQKGGIWVLDLLFDSFGHHNRLLHFSKNNWKEPDLILDESNMGAILGAKRPEDFFFVPSANSSGKAGKFLLPEMISGTIHLNWYNSSSPYNEISEVPGINYFVSPSELTFDNKGNLWVIDKASNINVVHKLNAIDYKKSASYDLPPGIGYQLSMGYNQAVHVVDCDAHKIYVLDESKKSWSTKFDSIISLGQPSGLAFSSDQLFIALPNKKIVSKINLSNGNQVDKLSGKSPFGDLMDIVIAQSDRLFVTDSSANSIMCLQANGAISWEMAYEKDLLQVDHSETHGLVALFKKGNREIEVSLISTDDGTPQQSFIIEEKYKEAKCISYSRTGEFVVGGLGFVTSFGINKTTNKLDVIWEFERYSTLVFPNKIATHRVRFVNDMAVDKDGFIYFTENDGNGTIILSESGKYLTHFGNWASEIEQTKLPMHIAISKTGTIYLNEENHQFKKYSAWTGQPIPESSHKQEITIIDNRPRYLLTEFKQIVERSELARDYYESINDKYKNLAISEVTASMLLEVENKHRAAFNEWKETEEVLEEAKEQLSFLGLDYLTEESFLIEQLEKMIQKEERKLNDIKFRISETGTSLELRTYSQTAEGYVDQFGIHLYDYMSELQKGTDDGKDRWLIIPVGDIPGNEISEFVYFIRHPKFSGEKIHPPSILFEEQYNLVTSWKGAGLGEFANAINLTPGESKELVITTEKKIAWEESSLSKKSTARSNTRETESSSNKKDDFQSSLKSTLENKSVVNNTSSADNTTDSSSSMGGGFTFKLPLDIFSFGAGASGKSSNASKRNTKTNKSSTLSDVSKNVKDVIRNTSQNISDRNKLSFSNLSEQESEEQRKTTAEEIETSTRKIKIENINEGKTVNYLFFQVTNRYSTNLHLENVRLNISTGVELIRNTGITFDRQLPLLNFDELLFDKGIYTVPEREKIVLAVGIAVLRRYVHHPDISDNMPRILRIEEHTLSASPFDMSGIKRLIHQSLYPPETEEDIRIFHKEVLAFSKLDMVIQSIDMGKQEMATVNSGQFYVDTQVGMNKATEQYLEDRRAIETELHQAKLEETVARTGAGVFYRELPKGVTHLSLDKE